MVVIRILQSIEEGQLLKKYLQLDVKNSQAAFYFNYK